MEVAYASDVLEEVSESADYYEEEVEGSGKTLKKPSMRTAFAG